MYKDIAIVGISMKLPGADNIEEFHDNLKNKKDCIRKVSNERRKLLKLNDNKDYLEVGYIEGIQYFDNKFFNISSKEAEYMSPEQRLSLQMAVDAILDAGYSLEEFRGSNCGVFMSSSDNEYKILAGQDSSIAYTGNLKSLSAGKISYYLDLRGPNSIIDATCASALLAVHEGCMKLVNGETDYSLAGGIVVNIHIPEYEDDDYNNLGVVSKGGRSRSFDADADGTGIGEGGGFILLKRLDDAVKDNDHIYGVIKGSAVNSDGARGSSLTAPSVDGQKDAILKAWERAGINPEEITDIESHGTGTLIGDPIEIESLQECFSNYTDKKSFAYLGAVKSSIGHLAEASGISSVLKCITQFNKNVSYPIVHYKNPNPYINFSETSIIPTDKIIKWNESDKRIAVINSFGFCGTNVHVVLENYIENETYTDNNHDNYIVKVSAKTESAFYNNISILIDFIKKYDGSLSSLCYTLNCGRDDYEYRESITFKDKEELVNKLKNSRYEKISKNEKKLVLIIRNDNHNLRNQLEDKIDIYEKLKNIGMKFDYILADELGKRIILCADGKMNINKAVEEIESLPENNSNDKYIEAVTKLNSESDILLIQISDVKKSDKSAVFGDIIRIDICRDNYLEALSELYRKGVYINWSNLYRKNSLKKVSAPTYAFDKNECWIYPKEEQKNKVTPNNNDENSCENYTENDINNKLKDLWCDLLEVDEVNDSDDFFDLGGNSLTGMIFIEEVEKLFNVKIEFDEIYDNETFEKCKNFIINKMKKKNNDNCDNEFKVSVNKNIDICELSSLQKIVYYSNTVHRENSAWNLCMTVGIKGRIDVNKLNEGIAHIIDRHSCFRTVFLEEEGIPKQKILKDYKYKIKEYMPEGYNDNERFETAVKSINKKANRTLALDKPPFEVEIYNINKENSILFINISHIISDGSSLVIFAKELVEYYNGVEIKNDIDSELQYTDYNLWVQKFLDSDKGKKQHKFWLNELKDINLDLTMKGDRNGREEEYIGDATGFLIEKDLYNSLSELSRREKASMCAISLCAYLILLSKKTNESDVFISLASANRRNTEFSGICGCLADAVTIRNIFKEKETIKETLKKIRNTLNQALDNQEYSYYELISEIKNDKNLKMTKISEFLLTFQNYRTTDLSFNGTDLYKINIDKKGCMGSILLCLYEADDKMMGMISYNNNMYSKEFIDKFIKEYIDILKIMSEDQDKLVEEIIHS